MSFEQAVRNALWNGRLSDTIVRSIAVVALVLAIIGLYAVTGHTVERWTRELGLRIALGAKSSQIGWLVMRRVLMQLSLGLVVGIAGVIAFDRAFNEPSARAGGFRWTIQVRWPSSSSPSSSSPSSHAWFRFAVRRRSIRWRRSGRRAGPVLDLDGRRVFRTPRREPSRVTRCDDSSFDCSMSSAPIAPTGT